MRLSAPSGLQVERGKRFGRNRIPAPRLVTFMELVVQALKVKITSWLARQSTPHSHSTPHSQATSYLDILSPKYKQ